MGNGDLTGIPVPDITKEFLPISEPHGECIPDP
jgi:hypothetical protein